MRSQTDNRYYTARSCGACLIILALVLATVSPGSAFAINPTTPAIEISPTAETLFLPGTFQVVKNELGNQTNPHVDCNIASYTFDDLQGSSTIHYQDLSTGIDNIVPGNAVDLLSDVSGSRIAFTEVDFPGERVVVFDTVSETRTVVPGLGRMRPSIGGMLVAFESRAPASNAIEIGVYDLNSETLTQLTNDSLQNRSASVSPDGQALVWEKCQANGLGCDIYAALQTSPGVFVTRPLADGDGEDRLPDTNGQLAVYVSNRSGENDVYYQPVVGGAEVRLAIPGEQRDVSISGQLISFESQVLTGYEIFVYDIATSRLFQVTSTPDDETLSELSVCNGVGRIVYSLPGIGDFDVHAFTFQPPSGTQSEIDDLISWVLSFNLPPGTTNSLVSKLQDALAAVESSDTATACSLLTAFVNECQAQSGKKLTPEQSTQLITSANQIKTDLGCQ